MFFSCPISLEYLQWNKSNTRFTPNCYFFLPRNLPSTLPFFSLPDWLMVSILSVSGTPEFLLCHMLLHVFISTLYYLLLCTGRVFLLPSIWPTLAYTGPAPSASLLPVGWRELLELVLSACLAPAAPPASGQTGGWVSGSGGDT